LPSHPLRANRSLLHRRKIGSDFWTLSTRKDCV